MSFKTSKNLLPRGAVNARIGDGGFPTVKVFVLRSEAVKFATTQCVLLNVINTTLNLAFVTRRSHSRWHERASVVFAEFNELGVEFGVIKVGRFDGALGVVKDDLQWHAADRPKSVFKTANEALGVLPVDDFGVAFSRVT